MEKGNKKMFVSISYIITDYDIKSVRGRNTKEKHRKSLETDKAEHIRHENNKEKINARVYFLTI